MKIEIEELKRIKLEPGEILMVGFDPSRDPDYLFRTEETLCKIFPDNKVVLYSKDLEFSTIKLLAKEHNGTKAKKKKN
jgi:hypothetical protein